MFQIPLRFTPSNSMTQVKGIPVNLALPVIRLVSFQLGNEKLESIIRGVAQAGKTKHLELYDNCLNDFAIEGIKTHLILNEDLQLHSLDLGRNQFSEDGLATILDALETNTSIKRCNLSGNPGFTPEMKERLVTIEQRNRQTASQSQFLRASRVL